MATDPKTDRPRALHLLEAANFLRDAHFRDGLSVQEIGAALRHMADEADPMVGSLVRDGFGLDEIAAMLATAPAPPTVPDETLRDRAAEAIRAAACPGDACPLPEEECVEQRIQPGAMEWGVLTEVSGRPEWFADAVLSVLPTGGRAALLRAADIAESLRQFEPATGARKSAQVSENVGILRVAAELRRLAAGERDEQQTQQGGPETRDALMAAHVALAAHAGRQQAALTRIGQMADHWEQQLPEVIRTPAVVSAIRAALERADAPAAPVAGQPPVDTGEEPMFSVPGCTCRPFTRQGGVGRYLEPHETVDKVSGWEIADDCPHHKRNSKGADRG